jgi:hypothetical protein
VVKSPLLVLGETPAVPKLSGLANASVVRTAQQRGQAQKRAWMSSPDLQPSGTYNWVMFLYKMAIEVII